MSEPRDYANGRLHKAKNAARNSAVLDPTILSDWSICKIQSQERKAYETHAGHANPGDSATMENPRASDNAKAFFRIDIQRLFRRFCFARGRVMKLARYRSSDGIGIGAVVANQLISLRRIGIATPNMMDIIEGGPEMLARIADGIAEIHDGVPLNSVELLAPLRPRKFLALGMNYRRHAEEARRLGIAVPDNQVWFNKQTSCVNDPYGEIDLGVTTKLDYEVELGLVIGRAAKSVKSTDALDHVFGYLIVNDISARDWQMHSPTFTLGKSFDTHGPIGPWIVTADEIGNPAALPIRSLVNGEVRQNSNTSEFIHSIGDQIEYLSTAFTLEPGDILSTGTPEGVGAAMNPPCFLNPGDVVRCEIEGIGAIENRVAGKAIA